MSAPITDAHRKLRETLEIRWMHATEWEIEQIIADSEAKAVAQWSGGLDQSLPDLYEAAKAERDQLRAEVETERNLHAQTRMVVEELNTICTDLKNAGGPPFIRSEAIRLLREDQAALRAEVERLTAACDKFSNSEIVQGDWRARAERAEAELATERARLDCGQILLTVADERVWYSRVDLRAAIDAAMKEDAK